MTRHLLPYTCDLARAMIFVDGENLAIRYAKMLEQRNEAPRQDVRHLANTYAWPTTFGFADASTPAVMRKYYYTAVQGDDLKLGAVEEDLKGLGIETPRVFKKDKTRGSKRVDITLATDMLLHAARRHYDVAVLVAGDEDYIPLVRAVQGEGARVYVWFISNGMSPALRMASDYFVDLDQYFFEAVK